MTLSEELNRSQTIAPERALWIKELKKSNTPSRAVDEIERNASLECCELFFLRKLLTKRKRRLLAGLVPPSQCPPRLHRLPLPQLHPLVLTDVTKARLATAQKRSGRAPVSRAKAIDRCNVV